MRPTRHPHKIPAHHRYCHHCKTIRPYQRFDLHQDACARNSVVRIRNPTVIETNQTSQANRAVIQDNQTNRSTLSSQLDFSHSNSGIIRNNQIVTDHTDYDVRLASSPPLDLPHDASPDYQDSDEYESEEIDGGMDGNPNNDPTLPDEYIKVEHHPHSGKLEPMYITFQNPISSLRSSSNQSRIQGILPVESKPWAPFRTCEDFEFVEQAVKNCFPKKSVDILLEGFQGRWAHSRSLTIHNSKDVERSLVAARSFTINFQKGSVTQKFQGADYMFEFMYRDPWQWLLSLIQDPTLSGSIMWYPVKKYVYSNHVLTRIYDDLNSGTEWWEIQDKLPQGLGLPRCFVPLHLWLDKSNVSSGVKKHPIVLRAGFLPKEVRNGSGNAGGILIAYMPIVGNPAEHLTESAENEDDSPSSVKVAKFKREVYHKVLGVIFNSLKNRSQHGDAIKCGDDIVRILYPGFLIDSVDLEEAYSLCGTRGTQANYPCPRCLVPQSDLHFISRDFPPRLECTMVRVFKEASQLTASAAELLLKNNGLHLVKNFFWTMCNSSPYTAYSYDILHAFDSGEWGKHQWPLLLKELSTEEKLHLTRNMARVPSWPKLKHYATVCTTEFTDGNSYRDILKCIVPCLTCILPRGSELLQAFRWCGIFRTIIGFRVISEKHICYLEQEVLPKYEMFCLKITDKHSKSFKYPKHHSMRHVIHDLRRKGVTESYSTRPGEGFQQEVRQAYKCTNFKNTEIQMIKIDENQEAIAKIRMFIDLSDKERKLRDVVTDESGSQKPQSTKTRCFIDDHYALGSPLNHIHLNDIEASNLTDPAFRRFKKKLLDFLIKYFDDEKRPREEAGIIVRSNLLSASILQ